MKSDPLLLTSALFLALVGAPVLFASQEILATAGSTGGSLAGELLGPAWLGLAGLNWFSRGSRAGGIYGRPLLLANLLTFVPSALTFLRAARAQNPPPAAGVLSGDGWTACLWTLGGAFATFGALFFRRLFRPPAATP